MATVDDDPAMQKPNSLQCSPSAHEPPGPHLPPVTVPPTQIPNSVQWPPLVQSVLAEHLVTVDEGMHHLNSLHLNPEGQCPNLSLASTGVVHF